MACQTNNHCNHANEYIEGHSVNYNTPTGLDDQIYCPDCDTHYLVPSALGVSYE